MFLNLYTQPIGTVVVWMFSAVAVWTLLGLYGQDDRRFGRYWRLCNGLCVPLSTLAVVAVTLLTRSGGVRELNLTPLITLVKAQDQPEYYRTMLMNVLLFLPLGLSLSQVLPERWPVWIRVALVAAAGLALSILVEWLQYRYALGTTETDDVLCNTLGALLGASVLGIRGRWSGRKTAE